MVCYWRRIGTQASTLNSNEPCNHLDQNQEQVFPSLSSCLFIYTPSPSPLLSPTYMLFILAISEYPVFDTTLQATITLSSDSKSVTKRGAQGYAVVLAKHGYSTGVHRYNREEGGGEEEEEEEGRRRRRGGGRGGEEEEEKKDHKREER